MASKIKKGDRVHIRSGKLKGQSGVVKQVLVQRERALIGEVPGVKRHTKPSSSNPGGIVEKPVSIHLSNLSPTGPSGDHGRVGFKEMQDGKKVRILKKTGEVIDV